MNTESILRALLQASETRDAAIIKAHVDHATTLRQLVEKVLAAQAGATVEPLP